MLLDTLIDNVSKKLTIDNEKSYDLIKKVTRICRNNDFTALTLESKGFNKYDIQIILNEFELNELLTHQYQCFCQEHDEPEIYDSIQNKCTFCDQILKNRFVHDITDLYSLNENIINLVNEREKLILQTSLGDGFLELFNDLKGKIHNIVPFLGAGTSIPLGLDSWGGLLVTMRDSIVGDQNKRLFDKYIKEGAYLKALSTLSKHSVTLSKDTAIKDRIIKRIENNYKENVSDDSHNIKDITNLDAAFYITTNYDLALSDYTNGDDYPYTLRQIDNAQQLLNSGKQVILHLHGHIKDKESMVVSEEDYNKVYSQASIKTFLSAIMGSKHLLFIGFSFNDEYFQRIYQDVFKDIGGDNYIILPNLHIDEAQEYLDEGLNPISINVEETESDEDYKRNYIKALKVVLQSLID
ncbi:SIR2 family protein [Priestia megaterium]|uniref:SIR2 family protein n=1 Tax=Priestia megaterium TaxID=1404 RepID=UPI0034D77D08